MANIRMTQRFNLLDLPNELLTKIFDTLCLHCHSDPNEVADYDTADAWESKRCLARICRVSRATRSIAQPILFHYYASGNMQKITGYREVTQRPEADDQLLAFLCSIIRQPKLAHAVRVLSFVPGSFPNGMKYHTASFLIEESQRIGLAPPIEDPITLQERLENLNREIPDTAPDPRARPDPLYTGRVNHWLQGLAISNCPCIEQLHINYLTPGWRATAALAPNVMLDRLKVFAVTTGQGPHFFAPHISKLVNAAPNLKIFCGADIDFNFEMGVRLNGLEKLSVNGPTSGVLQILLSYCPKLQDLEYYQDPFLPSIARESDFEIVKHTLRRLCFSVVPHAAYPGVSRYGPQPTGRETSYFTMLTVFDHVNCGGGLSFRDFECLEILETDYFLLYGRAREVQDDDDDDFHPRLGGILPDSIRILHIGFVTDWKHMCEELIALASEIISGRFPKLEIIRADVVTSSCIFQFYSAVEVAMSATKVEFVVGLCPTCSVARGMLPGRPAGVDVFSEEMVNYTL